MLAVRRKIGRQPYQKTEPILMPDPLRFAPLCGDAMLISHMLSVAFRVFGGNGGPKKYRWVHK